jgi:outer membrane lipoprotein-sorting protein
VIRARDAILAALLGSFAAAGCTMPGMRPSVGPVKPATPVTAAELIAKLDARSTAIRSFRALAAMRYADAKDKIAVKEVVVVERPDRLRIEMMGTFGIALQIATDGKTLNAYHRGERTFYTGRATMLNFARFTRIQIGMEDIADLLMGIPPKRSRSGDPIMRFETPAGLWRVSMQSNAGDTTTVWFDPDSLVPTKANEVDRRGRVKYAASYFDYQTFADVTVPTRVRFEIPAQEAQVELRYSNVSVNTALEPGLFHFEAPSGARVVDLDALRDPAVGSAN